MAVESPPFALQEGSYGGEITRRAIFASHLRGGSIGTVVGGLVVPGDCAVTAGTGMHVIVAPGEIIIPNSTAGASGYYARATSNTEEVIAASDPTNPRIDRISALVKDKAYSGTENLWKVAVETGTPTAGATLANENGIAAAPSNSITLAIVLVPAGSSSVTNGNIEAKATPATPGLTGASYREGTAAARPAAGVKGRIWYATDTKVYSVDTGTEWIAVPPSIPTTAKYGALTERTLAKAETPSATRPTQVVLTGVSKETGVLATMNVTVGGVLIGGASCWQGSGTKTNITFSFICPPGVAWEATNAGNVESVKSSYLTL
jgi:hypothetical protein